MKKRCQSTSSNRSFCLGKHESPYGDHDLQILGKKKRVRDWRILPATMFRQANFNEWGSGAAHPWHFPLHLAPLFWSEFQIVLLPWKQSQGLFVGKKRVRNWKVSPQLQIPWKFENVGNNKNVNAPWKLGGKTDHANSNKNKELPIKSPRTPQIPRS